jgi:hypothetical protein
VQLYASNVRGAVFTLKERDFYFIDKEKGKLPFFVDLCRICVMMLIIICDSLFKVHSAGIAERPSFKCEGFWEKRKNSFAFVSLNMNAIRTNCSILDTALKTPLFSNAGCLA